MDEFVFDHTVSSLACDHRILDLDQYKIHGKVSVYAHVMHVCEKSKRIIKALRISNIDPISMARGCVLHDYYLYQIKDLGKKRFLHGYNHPKIAYVNASKEFELNEIESNMILSHMFPIRPIKPKYKESVVLGLADKLCCIEELLFWQRVENI